MDADELRMLADLGLDRREVLSTYDDKARRLPNPREDAAIRAQADAHRGSGSSEDAGLRAWQTLTNFEEDAAASKLENYMSGQGHRADLQRQLLRYDDGREQFERRFGEERAHYVLENGGNLNNDSLSRPSASRPHHGSGSNNVGPRPSTPRTFTDGRTPQTRGRAPPSQPPQQRPPGHVRATSPRLYGTVQLNPRRRPAESRASGGSQDASAANKQIVAALRTAAARNGLGVPRPTTIPPPVPAPTPGSSRKPTTATAAVPNSVVATVRFNQALWCAAHTGQEFDRYLKKYFECLPYLDAARSKLVEEAINLAKEGNKKDVEIYLETHPEREWMFEAAVKARSLVEEGNDAKIKAHCAGYPNQAVFIGAAKAVFKTTMRKDSAALIDIETLPEPQATKPAVKQNTKNIESSPSSVGRPASSSSSYYTTKSTSTRDSSPASPTKGSLVVTFIDAGGKFLGVHQMAVHAPVQATISITACTSRFDPRELISGVENMAKTMVDPTNGLEGVRLAFDGLWVEEGM